MFRKLFNKKDSKKKLMEDIKQQTNDYFELLERYKFLRKIELIGLPDSHLENAVMSWMWNKFNVDWSNQYEVIKALPKPCQHIYSCRTVFDEINNGGFNQLFYNSTGQFASMAAIGFDSIGAIPLGVIMRNAIRIFGENKDTLDKYNDGSLESFLESYAENLFNSLDEEFYEKIEECEIDKIFIKYIRENDTCFGD